MGVCKNQCSLVGIFFHIYDKSSNVVQKMLYLFIAKFVILSAVKNRKSVNA